MYTDFREQRAKIKNSKDFFKRSSHSPHHHRAAPPVRHDGFPVEEIRDRTLDEKR